MNTNSDPDVREYSVSQEIDYDLVVPEKNEDCSFLLKYAYRRATDKIDYKESGEDYLKIIENKRKIAFTVCDGVSQSFFSALAAKLVGDELSNYLWNFSIKNFSKDVIRNQVVEFLDNLRDTKTKHIHTLDLPAHLSPMVVNVMEELRLTGSSTVFVSGVVDLDYDLAMFIWMGDSMLRLWGEEEEICINGDFTLKNFWSSRKGVVGTPQIILMKASSIKRIAAYSDGLSPMNDIISSWPGIQGIEGLITSQASSPESDDISFVEIIIDNNLNGLITNVSILESQEEISTSKIAEKEVLIHEDHNDKTDNLSCVISETSRKRTKKVLLLVQIIAIILLFIDLTLMTIYFIKKLL